ncbi:MAG: hypothetical protein QXF46_02845 [Thermofilaceae archaeon]
MVAPKIEVALSPEDFRKYPFLPEAVERAKRLGITLNDLAIPALREVLERAGTYVRAAIDSKALPPPADDCDVEILSYMTTLILLRMVFDRMLIRRFGVLFSKRFSQFIASEDLIKIIYILNKIGIKVKILDEDFSGFNIMVNVLDYIENIPESKGPWKLAHRLVDHGWVSVNKFEVIRLGEEALKRFVEQRVENLQLDGLGLPNEVFSLVEEISREWSQKLKEIKEAWIPTDATGFEQALPPCMAAILENLRAGRNIPHSARFALASFLLNIGLSVEEVLDVFKAAPDFNERIARYQVEHIAGMRGSKKKYSPYKCDNMRTLGLCVAECKVRHPLQYFWLRRRGRVVRHEGS